MQITLATQPFATIETEALVTYVFEDPDPVQGRIAEIDQAANGLLKKLAKSGELTGKTLEMTLIHAPAGLKAARMLLVGREARKILIGGAAQGFRSRAAPFEVAGVHNFVFAARRKRRDGGCCAGPRRGAIAADFESDKYKTDKKNDKAIDAVLLAGYTDAERAAGEKGLTRGRIIAESQNFARDLINEPSNKLTPKILAEKAEAMAKQAGLAVDILDEKEIADPRWALLLASRREAGAATHDRHNLHPGESKPASPVIGLVGKAVTFDTGGISIKPSEGMEK
jgi:leucyl aminopeptidase